MTEKERQTDIEFRMRIEMRVTPTYRPTAMHGSRQSTGLKRAFTLIELLVVVAVITILVAILIPSLSQAKENARSVQCRSNVRQLALGTTIYADMNNNRIMAYSVSVPKNPPPGNDTLYWTQLMGDTLASRNVWSCPSFPRRTGLPTANASHYGVNFDHAVNVNNATAQPRVMTNFINPSTLLLLADSEDATQELKAQYGTNTFSAGFLRTYCPVDQAALTTTAGHYLATTAGIDVRHNRKAAVAFMDGHAEMVDRPTLIANKDDIFGHIRWSN